MFCPKCKTTYLKPTKLEQGLPVMGCAQCAGSLVPLLYYRDWAERVQLTADDSQEEKCLLTDTDSKGILCCPKCARLMTKYVVDGSMSTRLDLCGNCDEAWLDGGEWQLLKSLKLGNKLPGIFTDHWQRKVRTEQTELTRAERLKRAVGKADTDKAIEIKAWLDSNPNRSAILHFLGTE